MYRIQVQPSRQHILVVTDEVDDFLDRDKLVFNICSNQANAFPKCAAAICRACCGELPCMESMTSRIDP